MFSKNDGSRWIDFSYDFTFAQPWLPRTPIEMFLLFAGTMSARLILEWRAFTTKSRRNALNHDLADKYVSVLPQNVEVEPIFSLLKAVLAFSMNSVLNAFNATMNGLTYQTIQTMLTLLTQFYAAQTLMKKLWDDKQLWWHNQGIGIFEFN